MRFYCSPSRGLYVRLLFRVRDFRTGDTVNQIDFIRDALCGRFRIGVEKLPFETKEPKKGGKLPLVGLKLTACERVLMRVRCSLLQLKFFILVCLISKSI